MSHGLSASTVQKIQAVLARYPPVEQAVLYGSRAMGTFKNGSDIDLTLRGGAALTFPVLASILNDLDDLLLPYSIDLSLFHDLRDSDLLAHIQRVGVTFYQKEG